MAINTSKLAKLSWNELRREFRLKSGLDRSSGYIHADDVNQLEYYIKDAYRLMHDKGRGWDPEIHAPVAAERVAVIYAKKRFMGADPEVDAAFVTAFRGWVKNSAIQGNKDIVLY